MKFLLVGGRFDGKLYELDDPEQYPFIEMNYVPPMSAEYVPLPNAKESTFMFERVNYQRIRWTVVDVHGQQSYRYVYAYASSPAQLFDRLLEHYAPAKDERIKALENHVQEAEDLLTIAQAMVEAKK